MQHINFHVPYFIFNKRTYLCNKNAFITPTQLSLSSFARKNAWKCQFLDPSNRHFNYTKSDIPYINRKRRMSAQPIGKAFSRISLQFCGIALQIWDMLTFYIERVKTRHTIGRYRSRDTRQLLWRIVYNFVTDDRALKNGSYEKIYAQVIFCRQVEAKKTTCLRKTVQNNKEKWWTGWKRSWTWHSLSAFNFSFV